MNPSPGLVLLGALTKLCVLVSLLPLESFLQTSPQQGNAYPDDRSRAGTVIMATAAGTVPVGVGFGIK